MSSLETHEAEQAEITAACEAGTCDHPYCSMDFSAIAGLIMDEVAEDGDNRRRAARALLCYCPDYDDAPKAALSDLLADALHLCDLAGWDFAEIEATARKNHREEVADTGPASDPAFARAINEA